MLGLKGLQGLVQRGGVFSGIHDWSGGVFGFNPCSMLHVLRPAIRRFTAFSPHSAMSLTFELAFVRDGLVDKALNQVGFVGGMNDVTKHTLGFGSFASQGS